MLYKLEFFLPCRLALALDVRNGETELLGFCFQTPDKTLKSPNYPALNTKDGMWYTSANVDFDGKAITPLLSQRSVYVHYLETHINGYSERRDIICARYEREPYIEEQKLVTKYVKNIQIDQVEPVIPYIPIFDFLQERVCILTTTKLLISRNGGPFKDVSDTDIGKHCIACQVFPVPYDPGLV